MVQENYTHIELVLDSSGSMYGCVDDTLGGVNSFINEQREVDGKCTVGLNIFSDINLRVYEEAVLSSFPKLTRKEYKIGGGTALLDALGESIQKLGTLLRNKHESKRPDRILFVVVTDGEENSSREFTKDQIGSMISEQEGTYDWDFIFLGADFDAISGYGGLVSKVGRSANYSKEHTTSAFITLSDNVKKYRCSSRGTKNSVSLNAGIGDAE